MALSDELSVVAERLPEEIVLVIHQHRRDLIWRDVMQELVGRTFAYDLHLDRAYTVRNYVEPWAVFPRYVLEGRVFGSYLRAGARVFTPL